MRSTSVMMLPLGSAPGILYRRVMKLPVSTLAEAKLVLDRERAELQPAAEYDHPLYVERQDDVFDDLLTEAETARTSGRPFRWFYTGHTGAGKSTEINRIIKSDRLTNLYVPFVYRIKDSLDINDLDFTDILLAIAEAVIQLAKREEVKIEGELQTRILHWGKEIEIEDDITVTGSMTATVEANAVFGKFASEVQVGGSKKSVIRQKLRDRLTDFIKLVDDLVKAVENKKVRKVLVILDTLDHVDFTPIRDIFTQHWASLSRPKVSLLIVVPLSIIHEKQLMAEVQENFTLLPNIRVFDGPKTTKLDSEGYRFFKEVISRLADLKLFSEPALRDIFQLSGGMLRDMIGIAGDACKHADRDNPEGKVSTAHVRRVSNDRMAYFHRLLLKKDYEVLREVAQNPHPLGFDDMGPLLHLKAILYFPNGRGWYALHPAVKAILDEASESQS